jgi:hypothetical protein
MHYVVNVMGYLFIRTPVETIVVTGVAYLVVGSLVVMADWKAFSSRPPDSHGE